MQHFRSPQRVLLVALMFALCAFAQERTGKIIGVVSDASGAVVPNVKLTASSDTLPRPLETKSDTAGHYVFDLVPIGSYMVTASADGFQTVKQANVQVRLGSQVDLNFKLNVGQISTSVEVVEAAVSLDVTSSRTATSITTKDIDILPKGRTFNSLLQIAPGVRMETKNGNAGAGGGGYQVDGASGSENSFVVDGVDVSDIRNGSLRLQNAIPPEFVQEVEVKSSGFEAQFGGAAGGVINVATRQGSNELHGQIMGQFRNDQMQPRPRAYYKLSPASADVADYFAPPKDKFRSFYPGGIFSGPLIKDRLHFTTGYMPTLTRTERTILFNNTTASRISTQEDINHFFLSRVDYAPLAKLQVNASYMWTPQRQKGVLTGNDYRVAPVTNDLSVQGGWQPSQAFTTSANYSITSRWLVSARYGYKFQNDKNLNYGISGAPYVRYMKAATDSAVTVPSSVNFANGYRNVSSTFQVQNDVTTRHNIYLDSSNIVNLFGQQHTFKYGYTIARQGNTVKDDYTNGYFQIYWGDKFSRGPINAATGTYGYYIWQDGVRHDNQVHGTNQGLYFQDTWRVNRRLTLNVGLRTEKEYLPPYVSEVNGIKIANPVAFGWGDKLAPRLGVAYDVLGDGKWKLAGSWGLYYDVMKFELARGSFGGDYWWSHVYQLNDPNVFGLGKANPGLLGSKITSYNNRTVPINAQGQLEGLDPDMKPFTERRFNVSLDHQVASRVTASVRYTRTDILKGIEDIGVLDAEGSEVYLTGNPGYGETRNTKSVYGQKTPNGQEFLVPKATRQYDGVEFRVQGEVKGFNLVTSYTWSRLYGNWSGLANSDESGRSNPNVSRAFDLPYYYFDASGSQKNVFGRLGTDRPHEIKLFLSRNKKWKFGTTEIGLSQIAYSGTPDSTSLIYLSAPTYPNGRGDMGRTPFLTQTDISIAHSIKLGERTSLRLEANALNVFNQAAVTSRVTQINRAGAVTDSVLPLDKFFAGYKLSDYVNKSETYAPYNPIYGLPGGDYAAGGTGAYQSPRDLRVGLRLIF